MSPYGEPQPQPYAIDTDMWSACRAENRRLREKAKRVVEASDKVAIDRDCPQDAYYEWCAAVESMREALADGRCGAR